MDWIDNIYLGSIKVGNRQKVVFSAKTSPPEGFDVTKLTTSCGCSSAEYDKETGDIEVDYVPKEVPKHLKHQGYYKTSKRVTIHDNTGDVTTLEFSAKVSSR